MILGIPRESFPGERRVALVPESVQRLTGKGLEVLIETHAGAGGGFLDADYRRTGAALEPSIESLLNRADMVLKIRAPSAREAGWIRPMSVLGCLLYPSANLDAVKLLAAHQVTAIAMENLPRTTVAQAMDVLSSQATAAGYRAVILAAQALPKFFPMLMTPAGTIAPARLLILGAGVAGLQAIATARRLGATVEAFDVRLAAREEVESLGAKFIDAGIAEQAETAEGYARKLSETSEQRNRDVIARYIQNADACIATALIPNQRAPILINETMVRAMRPGSVIVDLAAEQGGNCALTEPGKDVIKNGVTIIGRLNLAAEVAADASRMYSRNMEKLLGHFLRDGILQFDFRDPITDRCVVCHGGQIRCEPLGELLSNNGG
jgi:NAD(P) transhydrogenase subunit alpha